MAKKMNFDTIFFYSKTKPAVRMDFRKVTWRRAETGTSSLIFCGDHYITDNPFVMETMKYKSGIVNNLDDIYKIVIASYPPGKIMYTFKDITEITRNSYWFENRDGHVSFVATYSTVDTSEGEDVLGEDVKLTIHKQGKPDIVMGFEKGALSTYPADKKGYFAGTTYVKSRFYRDDPYLSGLFLDDIYNLKKLDNADEMIVEFGKPEQRHAIKSIKKITVRSQPEDGDSIPTLVLEYKLK